MRLLELFISEKISLTHLKNPLKKEIDSEILGSLHQIYYKESKLDPGSRELAEKNTSLSGITPQVTDWLKQQLNVRLSLGIEQILKTVTGIDLSVQFSKMKTGGSASGREINLSDVIVDELADKLVAEIYDATLNYIEDESRLVSTMFETFKRADNFTLESVDKNIKSLISVVIHEMVHVVQHDAQYKKGRDSTEYRSYLDKDTNRFHSSVRKLSAGSHTDADYRLYRGSPQEIAAFAQEAALKFLDDLDVESLSDEDLVMVKQNMPNELRWYVEKMFNNPENPQEYKVFKRFHKLMYQEVIRYFERLQKRRKKEAKKNNI